MPCYDPTCRACVPGDELHHQLVVIGAEADIAAALLDRGITHAVVVERTDDRATLNVWANPDVLDSWLKAALRAENAPVELCWYARVA